MQVNHIPNFHAVDVGRVIYRGGQPTVDADADDWAFLQGIGIKRVIKLNTDEQGSDQTWADRGLDLMKAPITTTQQILTEPDMVALYDAVGFIDNGTFIHCEHGEDRTGLLCGMFRLLQGWTKDEAYAEMLRMGFHPELLGLSKAWADV